MGQVGCFIQDSRQDSCNHVSVRGVIMKNSRSDKIRRRSLCYIYIDFSFNRKSISRVHDIDIDILTES